MNKKKLDELVEEGWMISQVHPSLDLTLQRRGIKFSFFF